MAMMIGKQFNRLPGPCKMAPVLVNHFTTANREITHPLQKKLNIVCPEEAVACIKSDLKEVGRFGWPLEGPEFEPTSGGYVTLMLTLFV